jgi:nucleoside-diphosphate-sugar epimerase
MTTAVVTGASGFIGSHLVDALLKRGVRVRCLAGSRPLPAGVEAVPAGSLAQAAAGAGAVFHLAGVTKALCAADYRTGNVELTARVLDATSAAGRFVHVSSLAAVNPVSAYGRSKRDAETVVARRAVIVRPPVVYGPGDRDVLQFFCWAVRGWAPQVGGEHHFSILYVRDLADGLIAAGEHPAATAGRVFELANPRPVTWYELGAAAGRVRRLAIPAWAGYAAGLAAEALARLTGRPGILSRDKIREGCRDWIADTAAAQAELGFEARTPLEQGVTETLRWYREAGWL